MKKMFVLCYEIDTRLRSELLWNQNSSFVGHLWTVFSFFYFFFSLDCGHKKLFCTKYFLWFIQQVYGHTFDLQKVFSKCLKEKYKTHLDYLPTQILEDVLLRWQQLQVWSTLPGGIEIYVLTLTQSRETKMLE